jgi:hypothetical protein
MAGLLDKATTTLGFVLHLALAPIFLTMGLVVPAWFVVVLLALWVLMMIVAIRFRANERYLVVAPFVAVFLLIVIISIGENAFDWTA